MRKKIGQGSLNDIANKKLGNIYESQYLQIAAPIMNPNIDYSSVDLKKFFSFHYHTMGAYPLPNKKFEYMEKDIK